MRLIVSQLHFEPNSPERDHLAKALATLRSELPKKVPATGGRNAKLDSSQPLTPTHMPAEHATAFSEYGSASEADVKRSIQTALAAKQEWQDMPFTDRAAIFLRAAELVTGKYRFELLAATMLGQGKNAWQAEIDAAAELADFFRYNVSFAQEIYDKQPTVNSPGRIGDLSKALSTPFRLSTSQLSVVTSSQRQH
jgi:1-pyrroline-5-carboxylate dehydrogenase